MGQPAHVKGLLREEKTRHNAEVQKAVFWWYHTGPYIIWACHQLNFCYAKSFLPSFAVCTNITLFLSFAQHLAWKTDEWVDFVHTGVQNKLWPCCPVCFAQKASCKINLLDKLNKVYLNSRIWNKICKVVQCKLSGENTKKCKYVARWLVINFMLVILS